MSICTRSLRYSGFRGGDTEWMRIFVTRTRDKSNKWRWNMILLGEFRFDPLFTTVLSKFTAKTFAPQKRFAIFIGHIVPSINDQRLIDWIEIVVRLTHCLPIKLKLNLRWLILACKCLSWFRATKKTQNRFRMCRTMRLTSNRRFSQCVRAVPTLPWSSNSAPSNVGHRKWSRTTAYNMSFDLVSALIFMIDMLTWTFGVTNIETVLSIVPPRIRQSFRTIFLSTCSLGV